MAAVAARLRSYGVVEGVLKSGADGPYSLRGDMARPEFLPAPVVVDTTAAGDSFNGAFMASYLSGNSIEDAMLQGHRCACEVIACSGAIVPRS